MKILKKLSKFPPEIGGAIKPVIPKNVWRRERAKEQSKRKEKISTHVAFAGRLDQPKLLLDLVRRELLPLAVHQGLGSDLVRHQALCSQADGAVLIDGGGKFQVGVPYSLQGG